MSKDEINRTGLVKPKSVYKSFIREFRYQYDKEKTSRFVNVKYRNAWLYWNL